jgi:predicted DNA-binding transcriptional regulator AlpA
MAVRLIDRNYVLARYHATDAEIAKFLAQPAWGSVSRPDDTPEDYPEDLAADERVMAAVVTAVSRERPDADPVTVASFATEVEFWATGTKSNYSADTYSQERLIEALMLALAGAVDGVLGSSEFSAIALDFAEAFYFEGQDAAMTKLLADSGPDVAVRMMRKLTDMVEYPPLDLVGLKEAAEIMGVSPQTVQTHIDRGRFPTPALIVAMGSLWTRADVLRYRDEVATRKARRSRKTTGANE